jgi:hypothetical protein
MPKPCQSRTLSSTADVGADADVDVDADVDALQLSISRMRPTESFPSLIAQVKDKELQAKLEGVWKDIKYLDKMQQLEDPNHQAGPEDFHIVPISGLVVSKLTRYENEVSPCTNATSGDTWLRNCSDRCSCLCVSLSTGSV